MSGQPHLQIKLIASFWLTAMVCATSLLAGPRTEDVSFRATCDGTEQKYVIVFPDGFSADKPCAALIALHGHGSDRWQFVKDPRGECRAARDVACCSSRPTIAQKCRGWGRKPKPT